MKNQTHIEAALARVQSDLNTAYANGFTAGQRAECDALAGRYPWREICEKDEQLKTLGNLLDEKLKLIYLHEEMHDNHRCELDEKAAEIERLKNDARMTACEQVSAQALHAEIHRQNEEIRRVNADRADLAAGLDRAAEVQGNMAAELVRAAEVRDKQAAEIIRLKDLARGVVTEADEVVEAVEVGDVWRSTDGSIRCVSKVVSFPGRIEYQHTHNGRTFPDFAYGPAEFFCNAGASAVVIRNAFSPARHPDEPKEGFVIGDVWKCVDGLRTIEKVSDLEIVYRQHKNGESLGVSTLARPDSWPWDERAGGSTLVRR